MTTIVTRSGKGSALTISELDANFTNLNGDKVENTRVVGTTSGELTGGGSLNTDRTLGLADSGVSAGTIGNSATQITPIVVDAKGRVTGTGTPVTVAPAFSSITSKPTTLSGYGITDGQPTITGAATTIDTEDLTASRALVSDSSGKVAVSSVSSTTLGYLDATSSVQGQLDGKQSTADKDQANGYAGLNASGKLSDTVIPDLAISDYLGAVADETAMLALTGQKGDWCSRTDDGKVYVISGSNPAVIGSWTALSYPTAPVLSVNGKTGSVSLTKSDVDLGNVDNTSDATKNSAAVTLTNKTISGSSNTLSNIGNSSLTNSSITFGSTAVSLGGTVSALNGVSLGGTTPAAGAFTTLSASSTVSGTGFSTYLASPPAIGGTTPAAGSFTNLSYTGTLTGGTGVLNIGSGQIYKDASGNVGIGTTTANGNVTIQKASATTDGPVLTLWNSNGAGGNTCGYLKFYSNTSVRAQIHSVIENTGAFRGDLRFSTGENTLTERLRIDSSGNVGIGAAPSTNQTLYIKRASGPSYATHEVPDTGSSSSAHYRVINGAIDGTISAYSWDGVVQVGASSNHPVILRTNSTERLRITSAGNYEFKQNSNTANTSVSFNTTVQNALTLDASGNLAVYGGVALGTGNVSIKVKKITGTLSSSTSTMTSYAHGIGDRGRILSVSARADLTLAPQSVMAHQNPDSYDSGGAYYFRLDVIDNTNISLRTGTNSAYVLGKAVTITIVYEA